MALRHAARASGAVGRRFKPYILSPAGAIGASIAAKQVYDTFAPAGGKWPRTSPSKRPAMKAKIRPRQGAKMAKKYGQQTYGRNMGGKYYKRFKRAKSRKFDKSFNKNGVVYKMEHGSVESTTIKNSVYVGHGVAPITLYQNIMRALVKKLFALKGIYIENFNDVVSRFIYRAGGTEIQYRIAYIYRTSSDTHLAATTSLYSFDITSGGVATTTTWNDMVTNLISHIQTTIPESSNDYGELHFLRFVLQTYDGTDVTTDCTLDCEYLKFDIVVNSHLALQNRTNDASGSTNILSTSNNPVIGKQYDSNVKWLNGFDLSKTQEGAQDLAFDALYTNGAQGIIATNSVDTYPELLKKPPQAWQLGVNKQKQVMMQPGSVRDHKLYWKASMKFNTLIQKLQKYVVSDTVGANPRRMELGFCTLFGFESMLNDRSETTELQIGWELNQVYMVKCYAGKPPTVPMIVVV